ncbi:hypothetical protein [Bradyrhizobium japonicum]|nr:hypothetical protein [Bradyrhizobium japonicum]MCS3973381.1 hypothetical protein [Bradyrhizobium japonicum]
MALLPTLQKALDPMPSTDKQQSKGAHMKVIAIGNIGKAPTPEQRQQIMPREVPATLKLYLDGKIEQFWFRQDKPGVVFLMNVESLEQAKATVDALPLVTDGFATYELMQVGPLAPLGMLIQGK